jgi:ATP-dependent RNA helicase DbpA
MTPIQAQSLPHVLAGKDVIAQGKTGSGKTAAFGLGLLSALDIKHNAVQSLVLCPTRELADQVASALRQLARTLPNVKILTLCGGCPFRPQMSSLEHGAHIVVGTPGRVAKHLRAESLKLQRLKVFVLDEGDRMLEMGFQDEIKEIVEQLPHPRQTLLFSATYPKEIEGLAESLMDAPVSIKVESTHSNASIRQLFYQIPSPDQRANSLKLILQQHALESTVIFCTTKVDVQTLARDLIQSGFSCLALHGDLEQIDRDETLLRFSNKSASILVATDVASRGLDIDAVDLVVNFHIAREMEIYIHRIGRTGRAGSQGMACSLFTENERKKILELETYLGHPIKSEPLPDNKMLKTAKQKPSMVTLKINCGKKQKLRAGNVLGALTVDDGLKADEVGKININEHSSYVAIKVASVKKAQTVLLESKWKGRSLQGWLLG